MEWFSNLLSGTIGAVVGAAAAYYISYRTQVDTARHRLLGIVYKLGYDAYSKPEDGRPEIPFRRYYHVLWVAYSDLRRVVLPWKRKALHKAWNKYRRTELYDQIPDDQPHKVFFKGTIRSREEAVGFLDRL